VALLSIDFHALETDVRKEISLRTKVGSAAGDSILVPSLNLAPALEFERSDATRRLRLVLAELIVIMGQVSCLVNLIDFVDTSVLLVVPVKASFVWKIWNKLTSNILWDNPTVQYLFLLINFFPLNLQFMFSGINKWLLVVFHVSMFS